MVQVAMWYIVAGVGWYAQAPMLACECLSAITTTTV
jgi:hypothetical protein